MSAPENIFSETSTVRLRSLEPRLSTLAMAEVAQVRGALKANITQDGAFAIEAIQAPKADQWTDVPSAHHFLGRLTGELVVDIGCGPGSTFRTLLHNYQPKGYLGVDLLRPGGPYAWKQSKRFNARAAELTAGTHGINGRMLHADALSVVAKLPDTSVSVVLNGIDKLIMDPDSEYGQALTGEIDRVIRVGGVVLGCTGWGGILPTFESRKEYSKNMVKAPGGVEFLCFKKS